MEINSNLPPQFNLGKTQAAISSWKVGQLLQAIVIKINSPASAILQFSSQQIQAETPRPLTLGQRLAVEVLSLGQKPVLKVTSPVMPESTLNTAIRQALPIQTGMAGLLANMALISNQQVASLPLPMPTQALIKQLVSKLPDKNNIGSAKEIKRAIKDSGIFMEAKLGHTKQSQGNTSKTDNSLNSDLKASLLKLLGSINKETARINSQANTIRPGSPLTVTTPTSVTTTILTPPLPGSQPQPQKRQAPNIANTQNMLTILLELGKQVEGVIARTQLHQATSLPAGSEQAPILLAFELPIKNDEKIDIFHLFIEEDTKSSNDEEEQKKRWSITIALDLENLGPMYVRLNLANEKISTTFWAENPKTSEIINQHLDSLNQRYKQSGLEPESTQCFQGLPITSKASNITHVVLDVNA